MTQLGKNRLRLSDLRDNKGARKKKQRRGRGHNSGRGRKSGRGMKGQKAHSSRLRPGYIGGAKPLYLKIPKRGLRTINVFKNFYKLLPVSLDKIGKWIEDGRLNTAKPITMKVLIDSRITKKIKKGVKIVRGRKVHSVT
ncbi:YmL10 [Bonamia ostreae]|uniref:YmL10 n=1 Tax=Bonamia ostreae TaxID=126728 RepID=A0ABV2AM37_9EUKA